jgi:hypothetical protein
MQEEKQSSLSQENSQDLSNQKNQQKQEIIEEGKASLFNISIDGFRQLVANQIDMNCLFILESISLGVNIHTEIKSSKVAAWYQSLFRKGYITQDNTLTALGESIIHMLKNNVDIKRSTERLSNVQEQGFNEWWKEFPSNDIFEYKGIKFSGTRGLKSNKPTCLALFNRILNEGEYTAEDLIRSLKYEIFLKKEDSVRNRTNKLSFLSASSAYLNQRKFEPFVEISKTQIVRENNGDNNSSSIIPSSSSDSSIYSGFDI